VGRVG
jgi:hypothetical protein